jgi:hypothetical protein
VGVRCDVQGHQGRNLNLATTRPVSGSYHVADVAGLLWSLHPAFTSNPALQYYAPNPGYSVTVRVLSGGQMQAAATLRRKILSPASTETVRRDGFASTLFLLPRPRPGAPAVMVIGGSGGGEDILTAQALAMTGYPALALGYFQEPGLPKCLCDIPLGYFARAVRWAPRPAYSPRPPDRQVRSLPRRRGSAADRFLRAAPVRCRHRQLAQQSH